MSNGNVESLISSRLYQTLKWLGLIGCPCLALIFNGVDSIWGMADPTHSMAIVNVVGLSIGIILAFSQEATAQDKEKIEEEEKEEEETSSN